MKRQLARITKQHKCIYSMSTDNEEKREIKKLIEASNERAKKGNQ